MEYLPLLARLYADDVTIYRAINSNEDVLKLQEDLLKLPEWVAVF